MKISRLVIVILILAMIMGIAASCSNTATTASPTTAATTAATTAVTTAATTTAAPTTAGEKPKMGMIPNAMNDWNNRYYAGMKKVADENGWEVVVLDPKDDLQTNIDMLDSCITQGFAAVALQPVDNAAMAPTMKKAAEAGVIVITHYNLDDSLGISDLVYQVIFDQHGSGVLQAQTYIDMKGADNIKKVALIGGLTGADNTRMRYEGYHEVLDKNPNIKIVAEISCDWNRQKALTAAEDILSAHPDLSGFLIQDDNMSFGVAEAIKAAGLAGKVDITTQGFFSESIPFVKDGTFLFDISYPASIQGSGAMQLAVDKYNGKNVDRVNWIDMTLVTKENVDTAPCD